MRSPAKPFSAVKAFQIQAYPFRMTPLNMARHRNSEHMAFWRMLKQGYDYFEVTRQEPKVDVCDRHYVFNAQSSGNSARPSGARPIARRRRSHRPFATRSGGMMPRSRSS